MSASPIPISTPNPRAAVQSLPFFSTRAAQMAMQSLDRIAAEGIMGMVVARPGCGKSESIAQWRRRRTEIRNIWIEACVLTKSRAVLTTLLEELGLSGVRRPLFAMAPAIVEALARDPVMVIIDEADLLAVPTIDLLRSIWTGVSQARNTPGVRGFPLALFGTTELRDKLQREDLERVRRRIHLKCELPALNAGELAAILDAVPGIKIDASGLDGLAHHSHGSFGWLKEQILPKALELASKTKDGVITSRVVDAVMQYVIGVSED